ncbi:MAG TPA: adenylyltransferase/cytidyltransferase family protein [Candidatus Paceibacterota bacterium]
MKRVVVFGIFDGVHEGHRDLFRQARELNLPLSTPGVDRGGELIVIVGRDAIAEQLKGKKPKYTESERVKMVQVEPFVDNAVLGDTEPSTYTVLVQYNPDVVCLGYDQDELEADLQAWLQKTGKNIQIHRAQPYGDGALHNSRL